MTVLVDGKVKHFKTRENFVGKALASEEITFDGDDMLLPPAMAVLEDGDIVTITRVERKTVVRDVEIGFETIILDNDRLRAGSEVELRAGMPGLRREIVSIENLDGERKEDLISSQILVEPVSRKIYRGTKVTGNTVRSLEMAATAYTAGPESCWPFVDGNTAVMKKAGYGVAAVDPKLIPLGTRLYIEGYGFATASDVGGAIRGPRIDLFMAEVKTARAFGRRQVKVYLLD